jgi:hypothetical protein
MPINIPKTFVAASIAALTLAQIADVRAEDRAREAVRWNAIDTWHVGATDLGCYMATKSARGTILVVGIDRRAGYGIVAVADGTWSSVARGRKYPLELEFDGTWWRGTATGLARAFLYMSFDKPEFLADFATKKSMTIWYAGQYVTRLPLTGTLAALEDLTRCEQAKGRGYRGSDPFDTDDRDSQWKPDGRAPAARQDPV